MAAGRVVLPPYFPARDRNDKLAAGALLYVYTNGTTTKASIYSNSGLTTVLANPVAANSSGQFPSIWAEAGTEAVPVLYTLAITASDGRTLGNPAVFDAYRPSIDFATSSQVLAANSATSAATSATAAEAALADVLAVVATGSDAAAIAARAAKSANLSDLASLSTARVNLTLPAAIKTDTTSGNFFYGTNPSLLTNTAAGTKNGDINTGFGLNNMNNATTAYACSAYGYAALNGVTTGHSNTGLGYQAGLSLTTGIMNTLVGVDAGYLSVTGNYNTVLGHHCLNVGAFTGEGLVAIGQQTARNFTSGNNMIWIGRNAGANAPATGSADCVVVGAGAAIAASAATSVVIGKDAVAITGAISDSVIIGKFAQYGGGTIASNVLIGTETFFRATGGGGNNNTGVGHQTGYQVAGTGNTLVGYRAGYMAANTTVNSAVCIGNLAGFNMVASGDLYIGNSDPLTAHLIWGNFGTQVLKLRSSSLSLVALPNFATTQAAASGGYAAETVFYDDNDFVRRTPASPSTETFKAAVTFGSTLRTKGYTVATLPAAGTAGRRAHVTDATGPTFLGALTGGGAVTCPVFDNGVAWVAG